jgi:hypothetical protein
MTQTESLPMTIEELEFLLQAINADRCAGRRTKEEAEEETRRLTERR